jgi:hypothetical protein
LVVARSHADCRAALKHKPERQALDFDAMRELGMAASLPYCLKKKIEPMAVAEPAAE